MENINTLKYYEELKAGGVPEEQAKAEAYALNSGLSHLATKEDLNEVKVDVKEIKSDLRKMFYGITIGFVVLFIKSFFGAI